MGAVAALSVGMQIQNEIMDTMFTEEYKEKRKEIQSLKRKGIGVVEIRDKDSIETYHPFEGMLEDLQRFVKRNNKWTLEEEGWGKIKTGKYILTRIYRKYVTKKEKEFWDTCPECGRSY